MILAPHEMFEPLPPAGLANGKAHEKTETISEWQQIVPVPDDVPCVIPWHRLGEPSATWIYCDAQGRMLQKVCRWELDDGDKTIMPLIYCRNTTGKHAWRFQHPLAPRPLFNLDRIAASPNASAPRSARCAPRPPPTSGWSASRSASTSPRRLEQQRGRPRNAPIPSGSRAHPQPRRWQTNNSSLFRIS